MSRPCWKLNWPLLTRILKQHMQNIQSMQNMQNMHIRGRVWPGLPVIFLNLVGFPFMSYSSIPAHAAVSSFPLNLKHSVSSFLKTLCLTCFTFSPQWELTFNKKNHSYHHGNCFPKVWQGGEGWSWTDPLGGFVSLQTTLMWSEQCGNMELKLILGVGGRFVDEGHYAQGSQDSSRLSLSKVAHCTQYANVGQGLHIARFKIKFFIPF